MLLVLANEVDPDARFLVEALADTLPDCRVYDYPAEGARPELDGVDGVVVSGSTAGVYEADRHPWMADQAAFLRELVAREVPTLGGCFGHQLVNDALGGAVEHRRLTARLVRADLADDPLFADVSPVIPVVHGDVVPGVGRENIRRSSRAGGAWRATHLFGWCSQGHRNRRGPATPSREPRLEPTRPSRFRLARTAVAREP